MSEQWTITVCSKCRREGTCACGFYGSRGEYAGPNKERITVVPGSTLAERERELEITREGYEATLKRVARERDEARGAFGSNEQVLQARLAECAEALREMKRKRKAGLGPEALDGIDAALANLERPTGEEG